MQRCTTRWLARSRTNNANDQEIRRLDITHKQLAFLRSLRYVLYVYASYVRLGVQQSMAERACFYLSLKRRVNEAETNCAETKYSNVVTVKYRIARNIVRIDSTRKLLFDS